MQKQINIGVDADGVLTNWEEFQISRGLPFFTKKFAIANKLDIKDITPDDIIKNYNGCNLYEIFGCSKKEYDEFWYKKIWEYIFTYPFRPDASPVLNKLQEEGAGVHIITSRVGTTSKNIVLRNFHRSAFERSLKINRIKPESITYCTEVNSPEEKEAACKRLDIRYMFEDTSDNIEFISQYRKVLKFIAEYNEAVIGENIIAVKNFIESYNYIHEDTNILRR